MRASVATGLVLGGEPACDRADGEIGSVESEDRSRSPSEPVAGFRAPVEALPAAVATVVSVTSPFPSVFDPAYGMPAELGDMARRSGLMQIEYHHARVVGAENLLSKAMRALGAGDAERAERLIQRSAQMPYHALEEESPGVGAASMMVYLLISDQFETSEYDDSSWLDVVLDVYPSLDPLGRAKVASVVHGFVLQEAFFTVSDTEKRRIRQAFGDAPLDVELGDGPDVTVEQRREIIRSLVVAAATLGDAYATAAETRSK